MRVLVSQFNKIGDNLLTTGLLEGLAAGLPGSRITVATYGPGSEVLASHPAVHRSVALGRRRGPARLLDEAAFWSRLLARQDLYIALRDNGRARRLAWLSRAPRRIGLNSDWRGWTDPLPFPPGLHTAQSLLRPLGALGLPVRGAPAVHTRPEDEARAAEFAPGRPFVLLHPFCGLGYKSLPDGLCCRLARRCAGRGLAVVLSCGPGGEERRDLRRLARILADLPPVVVEGDLDLCAWAALARRARLHVGCDTAAMHAAAAAGTPVLAVFGPSNAGRWGPWDPAWTDNPWRPRGGVQRAGRHAVVQAPLACVPCGLAGCEGRGLSRCLSGELGDDAERTLDAMLDAPAS